MAVSEALKGPAVSCNLEDLVANALAPAPLPRALSLPSSDVPEGRGAGSSILPRGAVSRSVKSPAAFRTISEVAEDLGVPQHVLRFWETKFSSIRPLKRGGGRRYYRPEDVNLLKRIHDLLYTEGYTIKGAQKFLRGAGRGGSSVESPQKEASALLLSGPQDSSPDKEMSLVAQPLVIEEDSKDLMPDSSALSPVRRALTPGQREGLEAILSELLDLKAVLGAAQT